MNIFTSHISNGEERGRIASRSPIDVYVPTGEDTQYVSDFTGNYWPFRTLTLNEVVNDRSLADRTIDRVTKFGIVDTRPPGSNFPVELFDLGDSMTADFICPVTYTGGSRDAIAYPVDMYREYDFTHRPALITPVQHPYELTLSCISTGLYDDGTARSDRAGISPDTETSPTGFMLRDVNHDGDSWDSLRQTIELARETISGDADLYLHEPPLTGDLVRYIRANPGAIDGIILPRESDSLYNELVTGEQTGTPSTPDENPLHGTLSKAGARSLRTEMCPFVRLASELSLLTSSYIEPECNRDLERLIDASVIPSGTESLQPIEHTGDNQGTLTQLLTQSD